MAKEDLGKSIGKGAIPLDRLDFVITKLGESFKSPYHALRQYIDNAKDAIKLRRDYGNSSENLIIIYANREDKSIRIIDHGPGIIEDSPIFETPSGKSIFDKNSQSKPYINSFKDMKNNIGKSVKEFLDSQTGENATGMLSFIKLNCKKVKFISKTNNKINTFTITKNNEFFSKQGGEKIEEDDGTEILLEGIDKRIFDNHFNAKRLEMELRKTYHEDIQRGDIKINLIYDITKPLHSKGRKKYEPFVEIKPMEITGEPFEISQVKTKSGHLVTLNLKLKSTPSDEAFVTINCRGTGGVPATEVLYNPLWSNRYSWGFIDADFLHFSGNDKSNFQEDEELKEFIGVIEEKIEPKLAESITKIKSKREQEKIEKLLQNLEYALSKTLRNLNINLEGTVNRTKKCPQCKKIVPYNQQECPDCGYEWPKSIKQCKFCGKDIPSSAKECPECRKDLIDKMPCPHCGVEIPRLSYNCPECGEKLREPPKKPEGKSPQILPESLHEYGPRSEVDVDEKTGKLKVIMYNTDHEDWQKALGLKFEQFYISTLVGREVAKYQFGKEKQDYSEDMIGILLGVFKSLTEIGSIKYQEGLN